MNALPEDTTMPKHIQFVLVPRTYYPTWTVIAIKTGEPLAVVSHYPTWNRLVLEAKPNTVWSEDCLRDVTAFMADASLMLAERKARKARIAEASPAKPI